VAAALRGDPVRVSGAPSQLRDVVYVADVATAIAAVLLAEALPHRVYNVGWGRGTTAEEILAVLGRLVPGLRVELHPEEPSPYTMVATPPRGPLDADRLHRDLGWVPRYDLESGLRAYVDWLRPGPSVR
jgi:NDP-hexose 4-ketoreductase